MHVHSAPDVRPRKLDDWELLERAAAAGMGGVVLKNHYMPTAPRADLLRRSFPSLSIFGGIVLNHSVGGLNAEAVHVALQLGAKVVWMPTSSAAHHLEQTGEVQALPGIRVAVGGALVPEMADILRLLAQANAVLATGHLSPAETLVLVPEALRAGVRRIVVTHPDSWLVAMSPEDQLVLGLEGVFLERAYIALLQRPPARIEDIVARVRAIGVGRTILTTDLGQPENPYPVDGFGAFIRMMLEHGFSSKEMRTMVRENPVWLLNVEGTWH
jgi:hypothetical protein